MVTPVVLDRDSRDDFPRRKGKRNLRKKKAEAPATHALRSSLTPPTQWEGHAWEEGGAGAGLRQDETPGGGGGGGGGRRGDLPLCKTGRQVKECPPEPEQEGLANEKAG